MATYQGIVDSRGRPIEKQVLTTDVAGPTIGGVRSPFSGYPGDGLTPQRLTAILREADHGQPRRFYELAEQVEERDHHYAGVLGTRKRSVAQIDISVEPAGTDAKSVEQAKLIEHWLDRDELSAELIDILDAIAKGESFTEIMWDTSEGDWRPARLEHRDPRWFRPDRVDLTTPKLITGFGDDIELPPGKFIHMVARGKSGIPARAGLARLAAWFWLFKGMTARDWAIYTATFGQPLRVGKYGPNATEDDKDTLFRAVANIAGDCAAIIPQSMLIEFVNPAGGSQQGGALFKDRADWLDQQMSKATVGQTTTTDAISGGHAVSREHRKVQEDIERADARVLSAALNRDLVRVWIDLQFGPQERYPRVRIARPEQDDLTGLSTSLAQLVPLGLRVKATEVRGKFGLSDPEPGDEVLQPRPAPVLPPGFGSPPGLPPRAVQPALPAPASEEPQSEADTGVAEADRETRKVDVLAAETGDAAQPVMDAFFGLIGDLVARSSSLEEVRAGILAMAPTISTTALATALRQAQVVARLSGRASLPPA